MLDLIVYCNIMGSCVAKLSDKKNVKVEDSSQHDRIRQLSQGEVAVIKNNWRKVNGILPRVGKLILLT